MTADRGREGVDRLRVGGWLPPARGPGGGSGSGYDDDPPYPPDQAGPGPAHGRDQGRRGPAHAAPDGDEDEERREPPAPYEAPHVDFDEPVPAPRRRAAAGRASRAVDSGTAVVAGVGRYVYQGRRRIGEMISGPRRQRVRFALAGLAVLALAVVAVTTLAPDGTEQDGGGGLALPTRPELPPPTADQELGSASPDAPPSPTPPRTTPPRTTAAPAPPPGSRPGPLTVSYEAEHAALIGGARVASLSRASGGRIVHNIGSEPGRQSGLISFTEVDVPATARYALTVDYVSDEGRTAVLTINTATSIRLSFPSSGGWDVVASRTFTIELVGGRNNLLFSNRDGWAPRLDRIHILG